MKYGNNLKWFLTEVSNAEADQFETGSIEIFGENEQGQEGSCEIEITDLMTAACDRIEELESLNNDASVAAIQFALETDDGLAFLRCWNEGDFDSIRKEWSEAPESVFIGADPLHPISETEAYQEQLAQSNEQYGQSL